METHSSLLSGLASLSQWPPALDTGLLPLLVALGSNAPPAPFSFPQRPQRSLARCRRAKLWEEQAEERAEAAAAAKQKAKEEAAVAKKVALKTKAAAKRAEAQVRQHIFILLSHFLPGPLGSSAAARLLLVCCSSARLPVCSSAPATGETWSDSAFRLYSHCLSLAFLLRFACVLCSNYLSLVFSLPFAGDLTAFLR